jgi:hypothetical protein
VVEVREVQVVVEVREVQVVVEVREVQVVVEVREVQVVVGEMRDSIRYMITTRGRFCNRSISSRLCTRHGV